MTRLAVILGLLAGQVAAESVVATRLIRPQEMLTVGDVTLNAHDVPGAHVALDAVIGLEARVALYPGRPVMRGSLGEPALVERNQFVELIFEQGGLRIAAEGRALGRGGAGERIRVMNTSSRTTLFGTIAPDGSVWVTK